MTHISNLKAALISATLLTAVPAMANYPAESYQLSEDGKTLEAWKGTETVIDMNSDAALASVTTVADNAFRGLPVTEITVGDNVTSIGKWAFFGCTDLTAATLPAGLTMLDNAAFSGCSALGSIAIPDGITQLRNSIFYDCSSMKSVTLPAALTEIGSGTFANCSALESVTFPATLTTIGEEAFSECSSLKSIILPDAVTLVSSAAFEDCSALESVTFGANLEEIESSAFTGCAITSLDFSPVTAAISLGTNAFDSCAALKSVTLPSLLSYAGTGVLQNCTSLTELTIPDTWDEIPAKLCYGCTALDRLDMGTGVETIKQGAFFECRLSEITWSEAVKDIQWNVFYGCTGITDLVLPDALETVDDYSFSACPALRSIRIGSAAKSFGKECFSTNTALESVVCEAVTPPALGDYAFYKSNTETATLYVPAEAEEDYRGADQWKDFTIAPIRSGISGITDETSTGFTVVGLNGTVIVTGADTMPQLPAGIYIVNGHAAMIR